MLRLPNFKILLGGFQARNDQLHIGLGCRNSALGLLLEAVQHIDPSGKLGGVHRPIGVASMVVDHFQNASTTKSCVFAELGTFAGVFDNVILHDNIDRVIVSLPC